MIKKIVRFLGMGLLLLIVMGIMVYLIVDKPLPNGTIGMEAEQLADEMLTALNKEAYDTIKYIEFSFRGVHHYEWWKNDHKVKVKWEGQEIDLNLDQSVNDYSLLEWKAYCFFINDSFWLVAPFKVRDNGVTRSAVEVKDGRGLLATYSTGGLTPGDSYLWIVDENGFPTAWKLWTSNVPIGGLTFSWDGWAIINDVWFSAIHEGKLFDVPVQIVSVR